MKYNAKIGFIIPEFPDHITMPQSVAPQRVMA